MRRDVFQAIADPTRRDIIHMIAHRQMTPNAISEKFKISRPAISRHIKILTQCGLISVTQEGRERYCRAELQQLAKVSAWTEQYRIFWNEKFNDLENFLNRSETTKQHLSKNKIPKK